VGEITCEKFLIVPLDKRQRNDVRRRDKPQRLHRDGQDSSDHR
jgi:hypothetical protein